MSSRSPPALFASTRKRACCSFSFIGSTHWLNRGPGRKPDGSYYQTPGISFLTFDADGKICRQFDVFDLAHQMHLCDELEDAGLLSAELKQNWVLPMKEKLQQQLARNT